MSSDPDVESQEGSNEESISWPKAVSTDMADTGDSITKPRTRDWREEAQWPWWAVAGGRDGLRLVVVMGLRDLAQLFPEGDAESPKLSQLLVHRTSGHVSWMPSPERPSSVWVGSVLMW